MSCTLLHTRYSIEFDDASAHPSSSSYLHEDSMYGFTEFVGLPARVAQHDLVQRMKSLRQLGTVHLVADVPHTRFDHSMQVGMLCHRASTACGVSGLARMAVTLAGMLHDVGHGPYSHFFDDIVVESMALHCGVNMGTHEMRSVLMVERILCECGVSDDSLIRAVQGLISGDAVDWGSHDRELFRQVAPVGWLVCDRQFGNDLDRLSYLLLDSTYALVPQPPFGPSHLVEAISNMLIVEREDGERTAMFNDDFRVSLVELQSLRKTLHATLYKTPLLTATEAALHDCLVLWMRSGMGTKVVSDCGGDMIRIMMRMDDRLLEEIADGKRVGQYAAQNIANTRSVRDAYVAYSIAYEILERRAKMAGAEGKYAGPICGPAEHLRLEYKNWWYSYVRDECKEEGDDGRVTSFPMTMDVVEKSEKYGSSLYFRSHWKAMSTCVSSQVKSSGTPMWSGERDHPQVVLRKPFPGVKRREILRVVRRPLGVKDALDDVCED